MQAIDKDFLASTLMQRILDNFTQGQIVTESDIVSLLRYPYPPRTLGQIIDNFVIDGQLVIVGDCDAYQVNVDLDNMTNLSEINNL